MSAWIVRRFFWALLFLGGCVSVPHPRPAAGEAASQDPAAVIASRAWRAVGRLAVKTDGGGFNAHFDWRQSDGASDLRVEGPLGAGRATVHATADRVTVESGKDPPVEFSAPFDGLDLALVDRLGFSLPLMAIPFWLRGLPDPNSDVVLRDGRFEQGGWTVEAEGGDPQAGGSARLPRRVTLRRGTARLRVVIDEWTGVPP